MHSLPSAQPSPSPPPGFHSCFHSGGLAASSVTSLSFLLSLPCLPLSDTSSLSVLLHRVLVEEDLWARSRHPKKYSSLFFSTLPAPLRRLALGSENMEHGCLFFQWLRRPLSRTFECPLPFFIFSFCLFPLQYWQSVCFLWRQSCKGA